MSCLQRVQWFNAAVLTITPVLSVYGHSTTPVVRETFALCLAYYLFGMIGITAGYHRLWSHRGYNASLPLRIFLMLAGSSAVQGSAIWWARAHRAHHRYTDTSRDPYAVGRGFLHAHVGWTLFKHDMPHGKVDISDLRQDRVVAWQHRWYFIVAAIMGFILPTVIPGLLWYDWRGGFYFACMARLTAVHHCTFSINSVAHWFGDQPYDDKHSARDHILSAILTLGEGYHNFHHQFPMDYRNAVHYTGFDPTKWFIWFCDALGLASHLRRFSANEIAKGALTMRLKVLKRDQDALAWPAAEEALPIISWAAFQEQAESRTLLLIAGFVHDGTDFARDHPGGEALVRWASGRDVTASFFGGTYHHSNAAHNLLAMMRVAVLDGGVEHVSEVTDIEKIVPPAQRLMIVDRLLGKKE